MLPFFQHLAKTDSWLYNKSTLGLFILNFFKAVVFNRIICKYSISPLLVTVVYVCIYCSQIQPAWSQQTMPRAIVMGLDTTSAPEVSEQILLQILRKKLEYNFDLSSQSAFEKSLGKKSNSEVDPQCRQLKCLLDVHGDFPRTNLFLLISPKNEKRLTLAMIGEKHKWLVKHEVCSNCGFSREEMITNLVLSMQGYFTSPMSMPGIKPPKPPKSLSLSAPKNVSGAKQNPYSDNLLRLKETIKKKKPKLPLEEFKYKLAQKQYNQLIGNRIKRDLMFFRHKNRQQAREKLKARLRLQINQSGKVIDRILIKTSGSSIFDKMILDTVDLLKLPPPMELLIQEPPYVVTILIQP